MGEVSLLVGSPLIVTVQSFNNEFKKFVITTAYAPKDFVFFQKNKKNPYVHIVSNKLRILLINTFH